jgi:hypothetical protein
MPCTEGRPNESGTEAEPKEARLWVGWLMYLLGCVKVTDCAELQPSLAPSLHHSVESARLDWLSTITLAVGSGAEQRVHPRDNLHHPLIERVPLIPVQSRTLFHSFQQNNTLTIDAN